MGSDAPLGYDLADAAFLMRLFLVAAIPLFLSVAVQMSIGLNEIKVIALAALAGSLVNLPISCYLTARLGVAGVIWGTVLTTLFSNLLVPGLYVFRVLNIDAGIYLRRSLGAPLAGAGALIASTIALRFLPAPAQSDPAVWKGAVPLFVHLTVATVAYIAGYSIVPAGRADIAQLYMKVSRR